MILLIDNYDSFVHNLSRYVRELGSETLVVRNDRMGLSEIEALSPQAMILSPGPCTPDEAGISIDVVRTFRGRIPILGVCLGHQIIAQALGGRVIRAPRPVHGQSSWVTHCETPLFAHLRNPFPAARYHSLIVDESTLSAELTVTARTSDGIPMSIESAQWKLYGVQFHPESILTDSGHQLLTNFLELSAIPVNPGGRSDLPTATVTKPDFPGAPFRPIAWPARLDDVSEDSTPWDWNPAH